MSELLEVGCVKQQHAYFVYDVILMLTQKILVEFGGVVALRNYGFCGASLETPRYPGGVISFALPEVMCRCYKHWCGIWCAFEFQVEENFGPTTKRGALVATSWPAYCHKSCL